MTDELNPGHIDPEMINVYTPEVTALLDKWVEDHGHEPKFQVLRETFDDQGDRIYRTIHEVRLYSVGPTT